MDPNNVCCLCGRIFTNSISLGVYISKDHSAGFSLRARQWGNPQSRSSLIISLFLLLSWHQPVFHPVMWYLFCQQGTIFGYCQWPHQVHHCWTYQDQSHEPDLWCSPTGCQDLLILWVYSLHCPHGWWICSLVRRSSLHGNAPKQGCCKWACPKGWEADLCHQGACEVHQAYSALQSYPRLPC